MGGEPCALIHPSLNQCVGDSTRNPQYIVRLQLVMEPGRQDSYGAEHC
jgi:hypothetical protein